MISEALMAIDLIALLLTLSLWLQKEEGGYTKLVALFFFCLCWSTLLALLR